MLDQACATMPNVRQMTLEEAQSAIIDWMNASWDFRQKINPYEEGIMKTTSTRSLEQFVLRSAANGLLAKAYMVK
jgi:hypothetical protein